MNIDLPIAHQTVPIQDLPPRYRYQSPSQALRERMIDRALAQWEGTEPHYTEADRQQAIQQFWQQQQIATPDEQIIWLQTHCLTSKQLQELALRSLKLSRFKQAQWSDQVSAHFLKRKPDLDQIVYSMIRVKDAKLANELYTYIQAGTAFSELASQYSQGAEAKTGGQIGPVPLNRPHPVIRTMLSISKLGEVCPPQTIEGWFVIIRLEQLIPVDLTDAMRQHLLNELFDCWLQTATQGFTPTLR